ncbi:MAG: hypothetical protein ACFFF9_07275 [Candidatus Thorarchaeota archaeon]
MQGLELVIPNLTTILIEFIPPVITTSLYLLLVKSNRIRRNNYIEAFILIMYVRIFAFFLRFHLQPLIDPQFDPSVGLGTMGMIFLYNFVYHVGGALQDYMIWIMVSFYSALFCFLLLVLRTFTWRRKETMQRLIEWEKKSDYAKLVAGKTQRFACIPKTDIGEARKEYFIIGLATIIPSLEIYILPIMDYYILNILIFFTWIYRFGYPATGRIAKTAGFFIREVEFEQDPSTHFGAFFKINILLSIVAILQNIFQVLSIAGTPGLELFATTYLSGFVLAFIPIIFAVLVLPLVEKYATIFCVRLVSLFMKLRLKVSNWKYFPNIIIPILGAYTLFNVIPLLNSLWYVIPMMIPGLILLLSIPYFVGIIFLKHVYGWKFSELIHWRAVLKTSVVVLGLYTVVMFFSTLFYVFYAPYVPPLDTGNGVTVTYYSPWGFSNLVALHEGQYAVTILMISLLTIITMGFFGHRYRDRKRGGPLSFALTTGVLISFTMWVIFPNIDYIIASIGLPVQYNGIEFTRISPFLTYPRADPQFYPIRVAFWLLLDTAMRVFVFLFIIYTLFYNRPETAGSGFRTPKFLMSTKRRIILVIIVVFILLLSSVAWHDGVFGVTDIKDINDDKAGVGTVVTVKGILAIVDDNYFTIIDEHVEYLGFLSFFWDGVEPPSVGSSVVVQGTVENSYSLNDVTMFEAVWIFA